MALPYPGMDFTPFDQLPASDLDKLVDNIESLADGSGFNSDIVEPQHIAPETMQSGWGFEQGNGNLFTPGETVTFPTPFTNPPRVVISSIGFKDGSDPSSIADFGVWEKVNYVGSNITATGFTARAGASGDTIGATRRLGYTWIATGV